MTRISIRPARAPRRAADGLRPVNLRADLRPLADLIELVFADSMDSSGRSAIREMRYLSHMGYGLKLISRLNDLALGISLGFVYVQDGQLVGNISIYPANYPKELGETWILANVAVHPQYQRRGIAQQLLAASLEMLKKRGAARAILQVNYDNAAALRLYERHGFHYENAWRIWRRSGFFRSPRASQRGWPIARPRRSDWRAEFALAQAARPNSRGGLGWLKPLHKAAFYRPLWQQALSWLSLNSNQRLIIRGQGGDILAACWLESAVSFGNLRAWIFTSPQVDAQPYAETLLDYVLSRYERSTIVFEQPRADEAVNDLLKRHQFKVKRELWHMRLDF